MACRCRGMKDYAVALLVGCFVGLGIGVVLVRTVWQKDIEPADSTTVVSGSTSERMAPAILLAAPSAGTLPASLPRVRLLEIIQSSRGEFTAEEKKVAFDTLLGEPDPTGELGPLALFEWRNQEAGEPLWRNHILTRMDTLYRLTGNGDEILAELFKAAHAGSGGLDRENALAALERLRRSDPGVEKKLVFLDRHLIRSGQADTVQGRENIKERDHE